MDLSKLAKPFPYEDIEWRIGVTTKDKTKGMVLAYVTNRAIMNRLDEVVGATNWRNEFKEWSSYTTKDGKTIKSQLCGISIWDEDKKEWITKWDGAEMTDFEAVKGGLSDSMKRAAVQWGIGRYLYNLEEQWVELDKDGKKIKYPPKMPSWALPQASIQDVNALLLATKTPLESLLKHYQKENPSIASLDDLTQAQLNHAEGVLRKKVGM